MKIGIVVALLLAAVLISLTISDASAKCIDDYDCRRTLGVEPLKEQIRHDTPLSDITCPRYDHLLTERPNGKLACLTPNTLEKTWQRIDYRYIADYKAFLVLEKENLYYDIPFETRGIVLEGLVFENNSLIATARPYAEQGMLLFQIQYDLLDTNPDQCNSGIGPTRTSYIAIINDVRYELDYEQEFHGTPVTLTIPLDEHSKIIKIIHTCYESQEEDAEISDVLEIQSKKTPITAFNSHENENEERMKNSRTYLSHM